MEDTERFIKAVYGNHKGIALVMSVIRENSHNRPSHRPFVYPDELPQMLQTIKEVDEAGIDVYLNMSLFKKLEHEGKWDVRSRKEYSIGCPAMWIDADACPPSSLVVPPSITLETSEGSYQAFWPMNRLLAPEEAEEIAKRLAYYHVPKGADDGGWQCNKYMRIPGTHNHKPERTSTPLVKMLKCDPESVDPSVFNMLPSVQQIKSENGPPLVAPNFPPMPIGFNYPPDVIDHWNMADTDDRSKWGNDMVIGLYQCQVPDDKIIEALMSHPIYLAKAKEKWGGQTSSIRDDVVRILGNIRDYGIQPRLTKSAYTLALVKTPRQEIYAAALEGKMSQFQKREKKMMSVEDIQNMGQSPWIIDGIIPQDSQINFFGPSGVGKSFQALDWAFRISLGMDWFGRKVARGPVVYVVAEGLGMMSDRVIAWCGFHTQAVPGPKDLLLYGDAVQLNNLSSLLHFDEEIVEILGEGVSPSLFIFDTLSQCLIGANENSPEDMSKINGVMSAFRINFPKSSTMIVHHTGYEGEHERGHSSLPASAATRIKVDERMGQLVLECEKQRGGKEFPPIYVEKLPRDPSLVFIPTHTISKSLQAETINGKHMKILSLLIEAQSLQGKDLQARSGLSERMYLRYKSELEQSGYITSDGQYRIYISDAGRKAYEQVLYLEAQKHHVPNAPFVRTTGEGIEKF